MDGEENPRLVAGFQLFADGRYSLAAAACASTFHAAVAGAVAGHDGAAGAAAWAVAHVVELLHGGGGVVEAAVCRFQRRDGVGAGTGV